MNKKAIVIIIGIVLLFAVGISIFILQQGVMKLDNVENIFVIAKDENLNVQISDLNDIKKFSEIFSKRPISDSPSCPFGYVEIQVNKDKGSMIFLPATDGCHIIKSNEKYFRLSDEEWEDFMQLLEKHGINRLLLESGKGI